MLKKNLTGAKTSNEIFIETKKVRIFLKTKNKILNIYNKDHLLN